MAYEPVKIFGTSNNLMHMIYLYLKLASCEKWRHGQTDRHTHYLDTEGSHSNKVCTLIILLPVFNGLLPFNESK